MKKIKLNIWAICSILILLILDQMAKALAVSHLKGTMAFPILKNIFVLQYLENRGAAFGILEGQKWFFVLITVVFLIALVYIYQKIPAEQKFIFLRLILILFVSGAIGNFIDRVRNNYVVDFFYFIPINFPIFNVADIYVTVGAFLLIISVLFYYKEDDFNKIFPKKEQS